MAWNFGDGGVNPWLIIKTDLRKEDYVARQIALAGFDAWVPTELIRCRTGVSRRYTNARKVIATRELPVLPKRLFAAIPVGAEADVSRIRHLVAIERDAYSLALQIPHSQIVRFRDEIDKLNREVLALAAIQTRKQKAKWRDLKSALQELMKPNDGKMEEAA